MPGVSMVARDAVDCRGARVVSDLRELLARICPRISTDPPQTPFQAETPEGATMTLGGSDLLRNGTTDASGRQEGASLAGDLTSEPPRIP